MKISLIIIGDEILLGQIIDTNSATIAKILYKSGLSIIKKWTVGDLESEIITALNEASVQSDVILITGGLGPTKDDITKKTLAKFMNQPLVFNELNKAHLMSMLAKRNIPVTENHLTQCYLPANALLLDNQMGTAMGMWMEFNQKIYISMPGVPYEMEYIMETSVMSKLAALPQSEMVFHKTIHTVGMGETEIADRIEPNLSDLPTFITLAYLPSQGQVKLRLTGKHKDIHLVESQILKYTQIISDCLKEEIIGYDDTSLEAEIGKLLLKNKKTVSTAESCTGGYLAHKITSIAGSSEYFKGAMVAYQNEIKNKLLHVPQKIIDNFGVVSEECVKAMVEGACRQFNSDYAIATSGVAGPGGGSTESPVGTVWIAYGNSQNMKARKFLFSRDRLRNVETAAIYALILFWKMLKRNE